MSPGKDKEKPKEEDVDSAEAQDHMVRRGAKRLAPGIDMNPNVSDTEEGEDRISTTPPSNSYAEVARKAIKLYTSSKRENIPGEEAVADIGIEEDQDGGSKGPAPKAPIIQSFREQQAADTKEVRQSLVDTLNSLLENSTYDEKCLLLGIAPLDFRRCVETAAGPGGALVLSGKIISDMKEPVVPFRSSLYRIDEKLARLLQAEQNELVAREDEIRDKDAEFSAILSATDHKENVPDIRPHQIHNPKYRPGEWGTRSAALTLDDTPTTPPSWPLDTEQERARASVKEAEAEYRRAGEGV
ncbi:hypothetical protein [Parasphingorhabdus sp.]|uniref:hypothetical protein n=1 Tax=Parasphingorhabdus sp. TaxID=2709688 RepID=UPI00329972BC